MALSDQLKAWAPVVSAAATTGTLVVAFTALVFAAIYYQSSVAESRNKIAADTMLAWYARQPVNTRPCLAFMEKLERPDWREIVARHELQLSPTLKDDVLACLSDQSSKDLPEIYDQQHNKLTSRGAFFMAERANEMLSADNFVAIFMVHKIGNTEIYERVGEVICTQDKGIIERLPSIIPMTNSFGAMREYIRLPKPNGCS